MEHAAPPEEQPTLAPWAGVRHRGTFRPYQVRALDAFERTRATGDDRFYLTMPPGSGKSLVGLEIARRLARPTLILSPNTAIQAQWILEWATSFESGAVRASTASDLEAPLTALTYQALAVLARHEEDDESDASVPPVTPHERRRQRLLVARGGDPASVLTLLHPNGLAIVDRLAARGPVTLVLDECHHLLALWGHLLEAVIARLAPGSAIIGLTATPPRELVRREADLYHRLFGGHADFEVVTPAVVKDGFLAPYQELAILAAPLPHEQAWIAAERERFDELLRALRDPDFATVPFAAWLAVRFMRREGADGTPVAWSTLERGEPALARAALRLRWSAHEPPPPGAAYREEHRRAPDAEDWIALLDGYVTEALIPSHEAYDTGALAQVRRALPAVGYVLTRNGIRAATSVVDRVLAVSGAKAAATVRILEAEARVLRSSLRAVVLCDFEAAGTNPGLRLRGVLDPGAGSAVQALRELLASAGTAALHPVLVTGRTVACSRSTALALVDFARATPDIAPLFEAYDPPSAGNASDPAPTWEDVVLVAPPHPGWTSRRWVPLVTRFLDEGHTRCLIGTRALLGEGWNCQSANVLVDLGGATTAVSVQQVRGRTLRLDPARPDKVADNWDVVVVADGHPHGDADYMRFVRKHADYYALSATGEIESGVSHVDPSLSPFTPPPPDAMDGLATGMLDRAANRTSTRLGWRIGEPYRDVPVQTVRIRLGRSPGLPGTRLLRGEQREGAATVRNVLTVGALGALGAVAGGAVADALVAGVVVAAGIGAGAGTIAVGSVDRHARLLTASATLEDLGRALADALTGTGLIEARSGAASVRVVAQPDGYYRCLIEGASEPDARLFAEALEELVGPLWEPRWIVSRPVEPTPSSFGDTLELLVRRAVRRPSFLTWHTVPAVIARRQDRVAVFGAAWAQWVSPRRRLLRASDPAAQGVLAVRLGDDPFEVETQLRTLWT